jgi:hypothetical protein
VSHSVSQALRQWRGRETKKEGPNFFGPFSFVLAIWLPSYSQTEFSLPRSINLIIDHAESLRRSQIEAWVSGLKVIKNVHDLKTERYAKVLFEPELLGERSIHVPAREAADIACAAAPCIESEYARPKLCIDRCGVSKHVETGRVYCADSIGTRHAAIQAMTAREPNCEHCLLGI